MRKQEFGARYHRGVVRPWMLYSSAWRFNFARCLRPVLVDRSARLATSAYPTLDWQQSLGEVERRERQVGYRPRIGIGGRRMSAIGVESGCGAVCLLPSLSSDGAQVALRTTRTGRRQRRCRFGRGLVVPASRRARGIGRAQRCLVTGGCVGESPPPEPTVITGSDGAPCSVSSRSILDGARRTNLIMNEGALFAYGNRRSERA